MKKQFPIRLLTILFSISLLTALVGCSSNSGSEDLVMDSKPYNYLTYILDEIRKMGVFPETEEMDKLLPWSKDLTDEARTKYKK